MPQTPTHRIAMWSGPRNLSTAMMRSFGERSDCAVWDEPFYAAYLVATGIDHPMRNAVIAAGDTDPSRVARRCVGPAPGGAPVFFQKHMTHHMIPGFDRDWITNLENFFLIREPERVVASYAEKRENPTLDDLGFSQQIRLFDEVANRRGEAPLVIDATRLRADPIRTLTVLCERLDLAFEPTMLAWPLGPRPYDGVWGAHWYGVVHASTGFAPPESTLPVLSDDGRRLAEAARPHYDAMVKHAI